MDRAEYNKWSARITPEHNVHALAFTRMLAGPMDYTPGGFDNVTREEFIPRNIRPEVMTTRAHALGLYVVFESALQMVSDYPEAYKGERDFEFIKAVPAAWDETRVLDGRPDDFIVMARRRGQGLVRRRPHRPPGGSQNRSAPEFPSWDPGSYTAEIYARPRPDAARPPQRTRGSESRPVDSAAPPRTQTAWPDGVQAAVPPPSRFPAVNPAGGRGQDCGHSD